MPKVAPLAKQIDPLKCMGAWFVQLAVPTAFDKHAHNGVELYEWDSAKSRVKVSYTFTDKSFEGKETRVYQRGWVNGANPNNTTWGVSPWLGVFYLPFRLPYMIIDVDEKYTRLTASSPSTTGMGAWLYIMTREPVVGEEELDPGRKAAAAAGWDLNQLVRVPQQSREERAAKK